MSREYAPVVMDDGRIGAEFTGMASAPAGTDPRDVIAGLRAVLSAGLEGSVIELEDIGLWLSDEDAEEAGDA